MVKGKPWTSEQEKKLRDLVEAKLSLEIIAAQLGQSEDSVRIKCERLKLEVVDAKSLKTTASIVLPKELSSVEQALKMLAGALTASCAPGLDKVEVQRLQVVATLARTYKNILADYIDYRRIENELLELRGKYAELAKKMKSETEINFRRGKLCVCSGARTE